MCSVICWHNIIETYHKSKNRGTCDFLQRSFFRLLSLNSRVVGWDVTQHSSTLRDIPINGCKGDNGFKIIDACKHTHNVPQYNRSLFICLRCFMIWQVGRRFSLEASRLRRNVMKNLGNIRTAFRVVFGNFGRFTVQ